MNHSNKPKLKRKAAHRKALMANQAVSLIEHGRIRTTLGKAKAMRPYAEKLVTLGKRGDIHARRIAKRYLRNDAAVKRLFEVVAPACAERRGGYCRITKLGHRQTDAALMGILEFVDLVDLEVEEEEETETAEA